jgi:hypothetical protein
MGSSALTLSTKFIVAICATRDRPGNVDVVLMQNVQRGGAQIQGSCENCVMDGRQSLMLERVADNASRQCQSRQTSYFSLPLR